MSAKRLTIWPPLAANVYLRRPAGPPPYPFGHPDARMLAWGRGALWHGVRAVGLERGDAVLVPAYHHGSEVEALRRAGLQCRFYGADDGLAPRAGELESLLDGSVRALHLIHYLGFPQDARRWRAWCDERGLLLIEDAAQSWLSERDGAPAGSLGDVAIWCLYKSLPLSEGAMLRCAGAPPEPALDPRVGVGVVARQHAAWLAQRSAAVASAARRLRPDAEGEYDHAADIDLRDPDAGVWRSLPFTLRRLPAAGVAQQRRANYRRLLEVLGDHVPPAFATLPDGASPMAFPVLADDVDRVASRLLEAGVRATRFWSLPHPSLPVERFPEVELARRRTLLLPVHQELTARDVGAVATAAGAALT